MDKFCYSKELSDKGICSFDNMNEFKFVLRQIDRIEKKLNEDTSCIDELRNVIIFSYLYKAKLTDFDRISFIKGIIYAKHYIDEDDIDDFIDEIEIYNKFYDEKNQSIYKCMNYYEDIENYTIDQMLDNQDCIPMNNELYELKENKSKNFDSIEDEENDKFNSNITFKDDEEELINDLVKDEMQNEHIFIEDINLRKLEPDVKLDNLKIHFEEYIDIVLQKKKIYLDREKKYVIKGMYFWFNQIYSELYKLYKTSEIERKRLDKSLYKAF